MREVYGSMCTKKMLINRSKKYKIKVKMLQEIKLSTGMVIERKLVVGFSISTQQTKTKIAIIFQSITIKMCWAIL